MSKSIHTEHRQRVKDRFLKSGLDDFSDYQALEMLLFYGIPQGDTNPVAHALIENFGSISQVLEAPVEELVKVKGVGQHTAILIRMVHDLCRFYQVDRNTNVTILPTIEDCARYLLPFFYGRRVETVFLLCLDAKCKVLCCREVGEGSVNSAVISTRKIVEMALSANATTVVLGHNHPSGIAVPSDADIQTTCRIAAALKCVDIHLADHIVVAEEDYVSMVQSGYRFDNCIL